MLLRISELASTTETRHRDKFQLRISHRNLNGKPTEYPRNREPCEGREIREKLS